MIVTGYLESGESLVTTNAGSERVLLISPWEDGDGQIHAATLRVVLPVERQGPANRQRLAKGAAVTLDASGVERPVGSRGWKGSAPTVTVTTPSEALKDFKRRIDEPVVLTDVVLGRLTLERELGWYRGRSRLAGLSCEVTIHRSSLEEDRESDKKDIEAARMALLQLEPRIHEVVTAAAANLHETWDRSWRDGGPALTIDAFRSRFSVRSVEFSQTRRTVWLDVGDLFGDHEVEVAVSPAGEINVLGLAG